MTTQSRIKSEKTFGDEFNFLLRHVPGALNLQQKDTIRDKLNKHFDYLVGPNYSMVQFSPRLSQTEFPAIPERTGESQAVKRFRIASISKTGFTCCSAKSNSPCRLM